MGHKIKLFAEAQYPEGPRKRAFFVATENYTDQKTVRAY